MNKNLKQNTIERILLSMVFLLPLFASSQTFLIKGKIVDSLNNPIPYASIFVEELQIGTNSDIEGYFEISVNDLPVTMQISSIGFHKKSIHILKEEILLVKLNSKIQYLDEVVVKANNIDKPLIIGCIKKRGFGGFYVTKPFQQIALMVNNLRNELYSGSYLLKSLTIKISPVIYGATKVDGSQQLRLRLYEIEDGKVGEDILHKDIFLTPNKNHWYKLDISHKIHLPPKGFVLAVEWIEGQKYKEWKNKDGSTLWYGLPLEMSNLKEQDKRYYSTWYFDPVKKKWGWQKEREKWKYTIPAFRIELSEEI